MCIVRMFVFMFLVYVCCSDCGVCGTVCCVAAVLEDSDFGLGVLKYVVCLCKGCDGCYVFCLYCEAWSCRCSCMASVFRHAYVVCLCLVCILWQSSMLRLYELQFINAGLGCKRRSYGTGSIRHSIQVVKLSQRF